MSRALDVLLTGRRFAAAEALTMGLVTRIAPADEYLREGWRIAEELSDLDPATVDAMKEALRVEHL